MKLFLVNVPKVAAKGREYVLDMEETVTSVTYRYLISNIFRR